MTPNQCSIIAIFSVILLTSSLVSADQLMDQDLESITVDSGTYHAIDLGEISSGYELDIYFIASDILDGLLMTDLQYNSWTNGGNDFIRDGSSIGQSIDLYTYLITMENHYWYVFDNSNQNEGGTSEDQDLIITSANIIAHQPFVDGVKTRVMISPGSIHSYELGIVQEGELLDLTIACENFLIEELDIFLVSGSEKNSFESGDSSWNENASILDSCFESWNYEVENTQTWTVYLENGPRGEASESSQSVQVDLNFWTRGYLPGEITSNTRMINTGESWRVDLGTISSGETLTFNLALNGFFDELDVLIMEHNQADIFLSGESATILGHPSLVNVDFYDSWSYQFPNTGIYSMIFDNSAEPQGGSNLGSGIHAQFSVLETTAVSEWIGLYQSRHYVEVGSFVSFNLGLLEMDDNVSYSINGHSHGTGFMNTFDILFFEDVEYQIYTSGGDAIPLANYSELDTWLLAYNNFSIHDNGHYWIVIDAADGPSSNSANANDAWTFDYTIISSEDIYSPQDVDENYEMIVTNLGSNAPEVNNQNNDSIDNNQNNDGTDNIDDAEINEENDADEVLITIEDDYYSRLIKSEDHPGWLWDPVDNNWVPDPDAVPASTNTEDKNRLPGSGIISGMLAFGLGATRYHKRDINL